MNRNNAIDLGRRAARCKAWRLMPGMADIDGARVVLVSGGRALITSEETALSEWVDATSAVPDLRDPATLGCLLALVREAHRDHEIQAEPKDDGQWECWLPGATGPGPLRVGWTEAEALVAALEAAP